MIRLLRIIFTLPLILAVIFFASSISFSAVNNPVIKLTIQGAIGPSTDDYVARALETATKRHAELVIIQIDTPGGLDTAMRNIIKNISNSLVPVASYVAPSGARAASAGTYILYASHIAAMALGTNLGAATPVQIGGISPSDIKPKEKDEKVPQKIPQDASKQKLINDAVAYIRSLAQLHGRNEEWAEKAVREAASLPAKDALRLKVIDIVASNMADLLKQIDGRHVVVFGQKRTLHTSGLMVEPLEPDWRSRLLSVITNPNIAYILMLIGIYGLILEFSNPGAIVPGTIGAIALILALYAFQLLPINYAGLGLILLGVALMVGEAFEPSFGMLGIGGVIAFVFGSIILIDTDLPGFGIHLSVIITFAVISTLVFVFIIGMAIKARRRPVISGLEQLIGGEAIVVNDFEGEGRVSIHSESWQAHSPVLLHKGQHVKVTAMRGLSLQVDPIDASQQEEQS